MDMPEDVEKFEQQYRQVRSVFIERGTSLNKWLIENGINRQLAYRALRGRSFGRKAYGARLKILRAAGLA